MKLRPLVVGTLLAASATGAVPVHAGGLFLPGAGAVSSSRAGAAVASADDGEALVLNPAGLAKVRGTQLTLSIAFLQYYMEFTRRGSYDAIADADTSYEGQPYATIKNDPSLSYGIGKVQPIPVIAVASDLSGLVPGLTVAAGLYAPNAYPFRDLTNGQEFGVTDGPPPPTRYDVWKQEALIILPSIAAAYRILPELDVGARFSLGTANLKSEVAVWGTANVEEWIDKDGLFIADATDSLVPAFGLGVTYRPTPVIELAAAFASPVVINAKGDGSSVLGNAVAPLPGTDITVGPRQRDADNRCGNGGTAEALKACVDLQLPMTVSIAGRYKFLDARGAMRGDLELNLGWENWGKRCDFIKDAGCTSPGQYRVVIDADVFFDGVPALGLRDAVLDHRLDDTYSARLGGSYHLPLGSAPADPAAIDARDRVILRGGIGYDTRAAAEGWLRADLDGAARLTTTVGGAFRTSRFEVSAGVGYVFEGSPSNPGTCNPASAGMGCGPGGDELPNEDRNGPDPVNPTINPDQQLENPIAQGDYKSSYLMLMLGASTWF